MKDTLLALAATASQSPAAGHHMSAQDANALGWAVVIGVIFFVLYGLSKLFRG